MSTQVMNNTCFVIMLLLYLCIDQGDGHWKERDREHLRHDIELYRKMAEKIEREIESFYDEYPEERYKGDNVDRIHYKNVTHKLDRKTETGKSKGHEVERKFLYEINRNVTNDRPSQHTTNKIVSAETMGYNNRNSTTNPPTKIINPTWPKFKDILLAVGKKYDWKNDRWVKVKEKIKEDITAKNEIANPKDIENNSEFHEKHKFLYRIVKLKSKSRRNVVVAVSAVR